MLCALCICPKAFEIVKFAVLADKYVYNDVDVIYERPLVPAFGMVYTLITLFFDFCLYVVCNRFDLHGGLHFAKHKEICYSFIDLAEV